ncbi:MAG: ArgE/DapE family deacylase [Candidatus Ranarchaeia archaeon]
MTSEIKERILSYIEKNESTITRFLQRLVQIPSVTGNEKPIQTFIAQKFEQMDLVVDQWVPSLEELKKHPAFVPVEQEYTDRPNVVGVWKGQGGGRSLLFNGHVDVIPTGDLAAWEYSPWSGKIVEGKLYGRGASDMKSGLAAMIMAVDVLKQCQIKLKGDVILECTMDEELSGNGTLACILRGYQADAGICCETSTLAVQPASIGRIWFEIYLEGKPAGIQRPWEGENAIKKGYILVKAVQDFGESRIKEKSHPLYPNTREALPCMITMFDAGSYPSAFPDKCTLKGSLATLPGENSDSVKQALVDHIHQTAQQDEWMRDHPPKVVFKGYFAEPSAIPKDHPIVDTVASNFELVTKQKPEVSGRMGAADTRFLSNYGNTPTVIFGPGPTDQMHATNEYVKVADLITATKTIAFSIIDWCGIAD